MRIPCPIRTARIPYDSDSSLSLSDTAQHDDDDDTNEAAHHSIAFVSIEDDNVSQPLQQEQENTPLSEDFAPVASSTQNRSPLYRRRSTQLTELQSQPVATQDPLLLSGTSTTTIPPFHAIVPCESGSTHVFTPTNKQPTASTQSQSQPTSSIIPPFQVVNTNPDVPAVTTIDSSPVSSRASFVVKQEALSQLSADTSGYENEVQYVPNPDNLIVLSDSPEQSLINFSDFNKSIDSINTRVIGILARQDNERTENEHYLSCTEPTTSNSSLEGRSRLSVKVEPEADRAISPPRIGPYIAFEAPRKTRHRQALATVPLAATTTPYIWSQNSHMMFLHRFYIQSVRYSSIPTTWSHSGMFQANPLTVHFNPYSAGLFSVPVCDQQACLLLMGMSAGTGSGTEALLAALAHVGKFRYGSKEPAREYYRLSITEKVLYLFFATIPPCPQDGGLVMYPKRKSSLPADGDEMWLEPFHYYAHMKPNKRQRSTDENVFSLEIMTMD
uniref:Uncharacterized protein n=1 Tax=Anopheles maculatus TaxID=74869 RepID=A0A182SEG5_9DIPT